MEPASNSENRIPLTVLNEAEKAAQPVTTCEGCGGVCCREQILPPFLDEIDFIPPTLQKEVYEGRKIEAELLRLAQGCTWLDPLTYKCMHYEHRPNVCREFETGSEDCLEYRVRWGVTT